MQFNFPNQSFEVDDLKGAGRPTNKFITLTINKVNSFNVVDGSQNMDQDLLVNKKIRVWYDDNLVPKAIAASKELGMDLFNFFSFVDFGNQIKASNNKDISVCFSLDLDKEKERDRPFRNVVSNYIMNLDLVKLYIFRNDSKIVINFDSIVTYNK